MMEHRDLINPRTQAKKLKLIFTVNTDFAFLSHRLPYAKAAKNAGYDVIVIAPDNGFGSKIEELGFKYHALSNFGKRNGPLALFINLIQMVFAYRRLQPDIIHHSSISACAIGTVASFVVPKALVINGFTGLGFLFSAQRSKRVFLIRLVIWALKLVWRRSNIWPLFQNEDDYNDLSQIGLCNQKPNFIRGSGVDTNLFRPVKRKTCGKRFIIGCAARLLRDKGFDTLLEAMQRVAREASYIELRVAGTIDDNNPSSYSRSEVEQWKHMANVNVEGWQHDMVGFWQGCDAAILLSLREGLPKSLIEAVSCGLPVIASDVPGCRLVVSNNENGFLVPANDPETAAESILKLERDHTFRKRARSLSRKLIINGGFSEISVQKKYTALLTQISSDSR